jgi:murein L,D-transpeptidase YcbB/YkuD
VTAHLSRPKLQLAAVCLLAAFLQVAAPPGPRGPAAQPVAPVPPPDPLAQLLRARLERAAMPPAVRRNGERAQAWRSMLRFYAGRSYRPAWLEDGDGALLPAASRLPDALGALDAEGLDTSLYPREQLRQLIAALGAGGAAAIVPARLPAPGPAAGRRLAVAADLELGLTYSFLAAAAHLAIGRVQAPERARMGWYGAPPGVDLMAALERGLAPGGDVAQALLDLAPRTPGYVRLREALARYRAAATRSGAASAAGADRIRDIQLNLERWRWMGDPGDRCILVNIPDYLLSVVEDGQVVLTMRVIVGKEHRETPMFSDRVTDIVLNPAWHIPDSIAAAEIAPHLLSDPDYLRRKGYEIRHADRKGAVEPGDLAPADLRQIGQHGSPFRLVQPAGDDNALGHYKFVIPDRFEVYLHDTPTGRLFARTQRDLSHGCVRLEKPGDLAAHLLADDPRWTPDAIESQVASGRTATIHLRRPMPVHILYQTAWVAPDGTVEFRPDVYHQDRWLAAALAAETPLWADLAMLRGLREPRGGERPGRQHPGPLRPDAATPHAPSFAVLTPGGSRLRLAG